MTASRSATQEIPNILWNPTTTTCRSHGNESANHNRETMDAAISVWSVPRSYKKSALSLQFSSARELTAEGSISWSQQLEVSVRWSQACEDVSPEADERPPLEAVTEQRDWEH
jgi:hypothetical protein